MSTHNERPLESLSSTMDLILPTDRGTMEKDKYARVRLPPDRADRIDLVMEFLHTAYELKISETAEAGETGLLTLFQLKSNDPTLPDFSDWWDIKENAVDIVLQGHAHVAGAFHMR